MGLRPKQLMQPLMSTFDTMLFVHIYQNVICICVSMLFVLTFVRFAFVLVFINVFRIYCPHPHPHRFIMKAVLKKGFHRDVCRLLEKLGRCKSSRKQMCALSSVLYSLVYQN